VNVLLGIKEGRSDGVLEEALAQFLEFLDLDRIERFARMLFLVKDFALLHEGFILGAKLGIAHESIHLLAQGEDGGFVHDRLAEVASFAENGVFFVGIRHKRYLVGGLRLSPEPFE